MSDCQIGIVGHTARKVAVTQLAITTMAEVVSVDDGTLGCPGNHARVLARLASHVPVGEPAWAVILEDDAEPQGDLREQLDMALAVAPSPIVSLYLGTGYPANWQRRITRALEYDVSWLLCERLLHAVGYAIRGDVLARMLPQVTDLLVRKYAPDVSVSRWALDHRIPTAYTNPSLVDHRDDATVMKVRKHEGHFSPHRRRPRKAHNPGTRLTWDDSAVTMVR